VIGNVVKNIGTMLKERAVVSPQLEAYVEPSVASRIRCKSACGGSGFGE
jgi:hypothetical protein